MTYAELHRQVREKLEAAGCDSPDFDASCLLTDIGGMTALIINLLGVITMEPLENPFYAAQRILKRYEGKYDISILDFHAEATSEKQALAHFLDGKLTVVYGTHTHVQTADEQILPNGTGYITDLGMTGPTGGILGTRKDEVIARFRTAMPQRFAVADGPISAHGALFDIDPVSGRARSVTRVKF